MSNIVPTSETDLVSVLILTWNRKFDSAIAIDSAYNQTYPNIEIVLIDNGSTDGTIDYLQKKYSDLKIFSLSKNFGCPEGRNRGIQYCKGEYIFFLDDDGILHKDAVKNAMHTIKEYPDAGVISGKIIDINNRGIISDDKIQNKVYEAGLFQGGICLHKKSIYYEVGYYPSDYMYGGEELFLSYKLIDKNIKIFRNESVILYHTINYFKNKSENQKRSFENVFITAYQLFPLIIFLIFLVYYSFAYLLYSEKNGFLSDYFKIYKNAIIRARKYKRTPIRISSYLKFRTLNKKIFS